MAVVGWFSENMHRGYPFAEPAPTLVVAGSGAEVRLPDALIADYVAGVAGADGAGGTVTLHRLRRVGDDVELTFRRLGADQVFLVPRDARLFPAAAGAPGGWSGRLVVGDAGCLEGRLGAGVEWQAATPSRATVEPTLARGVGGGVLGLSIANAPRRMLPRPPGCAAALEPRDHWHVLDRMRGGARPIRIEPGYGLRVDVDADRGRLVLVAERGAGLGVACDEVPIPNEPDPPAWATTLDGSPRCTELLASVNDQDGPELRLRGLGGIRIFAPEDQPHTLVVAAPTAPPVAEDDGEPPPPLIVEPPPAPGGACAAPVLRTPEALAGVDPADAGRYLAREDVRALPATTPHATVLVVFLTPGEEP